MKILHLTFHRSPQYDLEYVCQKLNLELETLYFHDYAANLYKPNRYKVTEQRAEIWWQDKPALRSATQALTKRCAGYPGEAEKDFYQSFDLIITSDTAGLSRIFLPHIDEMRPRLVVWICDRFDYAIEDDEQYPQLLNRLAQKSLLCEALRRLLRSAAQAILAKQRRLRLIPNTEIERIYCKQRGVVVTEPVIKPLGRRLPGRDMPPPRDAAFMEEGDYETGFYIPIYHNETKFMNLHRYCSALGLKTFHGAHRGADSLKRFKAIIHIPYAWSTWAFFDALALNVPYLVPTERFPCEMQRRPGFWFQTEFDEHLLKHAEWYCDEHRGFTTYFDNWDDLAAKVQTTDWSEVRKEAAAFAQDHHDRTLNMWKALITAE